MNMSMKEMAEQAKKRPSNFESLALEDQWAIDKELGILDWDGTETEFSDEVYRMQLERLRAPIKQTIRTLRRKGYSFDAIQIEFNNMFYAEENREQELTRKYGISRSN